ncbi:MAG: hypothetical protein Q9190_006699 [Brigantiaea leucoxantha]
MWEEEEKGMQKLTHRYAKQTDRDLYARDDVKRLRYARCNQPVVGTPGEAEAEHVLEDEQACEGLDGDFSSTAPRTMPITSRAKKKSGQNHPISPTLVATPLFRLIITLVDQSANRPESMKPRMAPTKGPVYMYPVSTSLNHRGGPRKIAASTTPIITVHPINVPCIKQAHRTAGWKKRGNGRSTSLKKLSSLLRPLNGRSFCEKVALHGRATWRFLPASARIIEKSARLSNDIGLPVLGLLLLASTVSERGCLQHSHSPKLQKAPGQPLGPPVPIRGLDNLFHSHHPKHCLLQ